MIFTLLAVLYGAAQEAFVVYKGAENNYFVNSHQGSSYSWKVLVSFNPDVEANPGNFTFTSSETNSQVSIRWNNTGLYFLDVTETDYSGCINRKVIAVQVLESNIDDGGNTTIYAGPDTLIGSCEPYYFADVFPITDTFSYVWEPAKGLSDPAIPNPVFTPGETTTYVLTVTAQSGTFVRDTVTIQVSDIIANAGDDVVMEEGTTIMLDGSASVGNSLSYSWRTNNGTIQSGENTAFPVVAGAGTYYLEVSDVFNCTDYDSVLVSEYIVAPVIQDIYDTTSYQKSVTIQVVVDEDDPQKRLDPSTLQIVQNPVYGQAIPDYFSGSITYTPNDGYLGKDAFEYQVCSFSNKCDNAHIYVYVAALEFLIPEAFTPNGDNINDYFEIKGIEMYPNNSITIINRWGKRVYEAKGYGLETTPRFWNGKSNRGGGNGDLPTGTYYYVLELGNGEKPIAGSVYIDR